MNWWALIPVVIFVFLLALLVVGHALDARDNRRQRAESEYRRAQLAAGMPYHRIGQPPRGIQLYGIDGWQNWLNFTNWARWRGYRVTPACTWAFPTPVAGEEAFEDGRYPDRVYIERLDNPDGLHPILHVDLETIEDWGETVWERIAEALAPAPVRPYDDAADAMRYTFTSLSPPTSEPALQVPWTHE